MDTQNRYMVFHQRTKSIISTKASAWLEKMNAFVGVYKPDKIRTFTADEIIIINQDNAVRYPLASGYFQSQVRSPSSYAKPHEKDPCDSSSQVRSSMYNSRIRCGEQENISLLLKMATAMRKCAISTLS